MEMTEPSMPTQGAGDGLGHQEARAAAIAARDAVLAPLAARVGALLTAMFRVGAALLAAGVGLALIRQEPLGEAIDPPGRIVAELAGGHAAGVIDLAILWLMAAPGLATVVVLVGFLRLRDRRYALVTAAVLVVLAASIGWSLAS
jgi:uncharacterized membrane protein